MNFHHNSSTIVAELAKQSCILHWIDINGQMKCFAIVYASSRKVWERFQQVQLCSMVFASAGHVFSNPPVTAKQESVSRHSLTCRRLLSSAQPGRSRRTLASDRIVCVHARDIVSRTDTHTSVWGGGGGTWYRSIKDP